MSKLLERLTDILSSNKYALAIGWCFTVIVPILTGFMSNLYVGIVLFVILALILFVLLRQPVADKESSPENKAASLEPFVLSTSIPSATDLIGREENIQEIYGLLKEHNIVSVRADGGVGKTAVASKIANQIKDEIISGKSTFECIAWITSTGNLKNDLIGLNIPSVADARSENEKYQAACKYLQLTSSFLVIDNMDEPPTDDEADMLNTFAGRTKILITARAMIPHVEEYHLKDLDPESALILFYSHYLKRKKITVDYIKSREDYPYAKNVVDASVYNALLIELIGKAAYVDHLLLNSLWEKLEADVFGQDFVHSVHTDHAKSHHHKKDTVLSQIRKLYEMSGLSEKQKELMSFLALFPAEHSIFFDVFKWAGFEDGEEDHLGALEERGWIVRNEDGYLLHTMVKGSIEKQVGKREFDEVRFANLINELADTDQYMPEDMVYTKVREYIIVPEAICQLLIKTGSKSAKVAVLFNNMAVVYQAQGDYEKALEYYEKAQAIKEKVLGKDHPSTAGTYNNMAGVYEDKGDYEKALEYYEKAQAIREKVLGKEHPSTATTYNNMAVVYQAQGDYEKALEYYEKAKAIREKVLGKEHPDTASTYNNMAVVYEDKGDYEKALEYYEKALIVFEKKLGFEHPNTKIIGANLERTKKASKT